MKVYLDKSLNPGDILRCFLDGDKYYILVDDGELYMGLFSDGETYKDIHIYDISDSEFNFIKALCKIS